MPITESDVFERIIAAYQTYESAAGRSESRTAFVWQQPDSEKIEGVDEPFALVTVVADSVSGTVGESDGYASERAARVAAQEWLGSSREVPLDKVPHSAFNWLVLTTTGHIYR